MNPFKAAVRAYKLRSSWLGDGGDPMPASLANKRSEICLKCQFNNPARPIWEAIASEVSKLMRLKLELNLHVEQEEHLHVCDKCDCYLPLKVWVPIKHISATTDTNEMPEWCWCRTESTK